MTKKFLSLIGDRRWEEARQLLPAIKTSKPVADTLKKLLNRSDVPPEMIRSLLVRLKELSKTKVFPTGLSSMMRMASNKDLKEFCREGSLSALKTFLQEVTGTYHETSGHDFTWPSSDVVRELIHSMWDNYLRDTERIWRSLGAPAKMESERDLLKASSLTQLEQCPSLKLLWQKTEALLLAYSQRDQFQSSNAGSDWLVAHAVAKTNCSATIMWFALRLYPEQVHTRDHHGNLPLHYAASQIPTREELRFVYRGEELNAVTNKMLIACLLDSFPEAARYVGMEGRLPLHLVLESYDYDCGDRLPLHLVLDDYDCGHIVKSNYTTIIPKLVKEYPEALVTKDPKTRFHPFVLAALRKIPPGWDRIKTDTVYTLLRKNPEALMHIPPSKIEREYRMVLNENETLKAANAKLEEENAQLKSDKAADSVKIEELMRQNEQLKGETDRLNSNAAEKKRASRDGEKCDDVSSKKRALSSSD